MAPYPIRLLFTGYMAVSLLSQWMLCRILQRVYLLFTYPFLSKDQRADGCSRIHRYCTYIGSLTLNPLWRPIVLARRPVLPLDPESRKAAPSKATKVIVMMNHLSDADCFLALEAILPMDCTWIAKDELFRVPIGGGCIVNAGDIPIIFKNKKESNETVKGTVALMMEQVKTRLRRGRPIAVFPEGTRNKNPENGLQPFKDGFFRLAVEEGAWILPLAISGTERAWPKGSKLLDTADTYFSWGAPVDARTYNGDYAKLRDDVWQAITDLRDAHPDRRKLA